MTGPTGDDLLDEYASAALAAACAGDQDVVDRNVTAIMDEFGAFGILRAVIAWLDTSSAVSGSGTAGTGPDSVMTVDCFGKISPAVQLTPEQDIAVRMADARARMDRAAFDAALAEGQHVDQTRLVLHVLSMSAAAITMAELGVPVRPEALRKHAAVHAVHEAAAGHVERFLPYPTVGAPTSATDGSVPAAADRGAFTGTTPDHGPPRPHIDPSGAAWHPEC